MPHEVIHQRFRNSVAAALAKFEETARLNHASLKGRFREIFVSDLVRQVLSNEFIAGLGLVVDHAGGTSPEADVVIFDKSHVPAVLYSMTEGYFPIEGVSYYGEIKSRLTKQELQDSVRKFRAVRSLQPLPAAGNLIHWPPRFLFAWSSDLKSEGIEPELERYVDLDPDAGTNPAASIICVVGKGYCWIGDAPDGKRAWFKISNVDGVQEVVSFIGGVANSLIDLRLRRFGVRFGNYIIPFAPSVRLRDAGNG